MMSSLYVLLHRRLQAACKIVHTIVAGKFGDIIANRALADLLLLRFIIPALVAPHRFGLGDTSKEHVDVVVPGL